MPPNFSTQQKFRHMTKEMLGRNNKANPFGQSNDPNMKEIIAWDDEVIESWMVSYACIAAEMSWPDHMHHWLPSLRHTREEITQAQDAPENGAVRLGVPLLKTAMDRYRQLPEEVREELMDGGTAKEAIARLEQFIAEHPEGETA